MTVPYRASAARDDTAAAEPTVPSVSGDRTRAIKPTKRERRSGGRRWIQARQMTVCPECHGVGCTACTYAGYRLLRQRVSVSVPPAAVDGHVLTLEGQGDTNTSGERGHLYVRLCDEQTKESAINAEDRALTRAQSAWLRGRARARRAELQRRNTRIALSVFLLLVLAVIVANRHSAKADVGESCEKPQDCRSRMCVKSVGFRIGGGGGAVTTKKCSRVCASNDDCPSGMACASDVELDPMQWTSKNGGKTRACAPR